VSGFSKMKAQAPSLFFTIARMPLTPRPALKRQQDGLYSELLEIEKSVYISSDVNLWEMDRDPKSMREHFYGSSLPFWPSLQRPPQQEQQFQA
jgi:hypothetical protein